MRVLLLHPPQQAFYGPHLGLPSLAAALRAAGVEVLVRDLNLEVNRALLTPTWLRRALDRATARYASAAMPLPVERALEASNRVAEALPGALEILSDRSRLHDDDLVASAFTVLSEAYGVLSAGWHPTALHYGLTTRRNLLDWGDLREAVEDDAENPFLEVLRETILPSCLAWGPDLVGIGLTYEDQLLAGLTLTKLLRSALPEVPIVGGGSLISRLLPRFQAAGELLTGFDGLVVHEGETALLRIVERLEEGGQLDDTLPNLLLRDGKGGLVLGPAHQEDLAALPTPDFSDLDLDAYLLPEPVVPLLSSRGCYWGRCGFCAHHQSYGSSGRPFRMRPRDLLEQDLVTLAERDGARTVYLVDEAVPGRQLEAVAEIVQRRELDLTWFGDVRMEHSLTRERLARLHAGGCRMLIFGLESGSQRVLDHMRKGVKVQDCSRILREATGEGIFNVVMVFVGFPGETVAEAHETHRFLRSHADSIGAYGVGSFSLLEGSPAHADPGAFGISWVADEPEAPLGHRYGFRVRRGIDPGSASRIADSLRRQMQQDPRYARGFPRELISLRLGAEGRGGVQGTE